MRQSTMLEIEFWWLVALPVFFGLGWAAARIDIRQVIREARNLPSAYFRALNLLVSEDTERATDVLVDMARAERGNTELQLALAGLFRRKGETDRAIRIHQSLLQEATLDSADRQRVTFELALDFLGAGLLDRAETHLTALLDTPLEARALPKLLSLYSAEKEWAQAIETARRLEQASGHPPIELDAELRVDVARAVVQRRGAIEGPADRTAGGTTGARPGLGARGGHGDSVVGLWPVASGGHTRDHRDEQDQDQCGGDHHDGPLRVGAERCSSPQRPSTERRSPVPEVPACSVIVFRGRGQGVAVDPH